MPRIDLDRGALAANIARAKDLVGPGCAVMFAVKSDAYGHGMSLIAPAVIADGADALAVLDIPTGVAARKLVPDAPLLAWLLGPADNFDAAIDARLDLGISTAWQLDAISAHSPQSPVAVHLKIDTGLHRNGASPTQWPGLCEQALIAQERGDVTIRGIWSHLADTSEETSRAALERLVNAAQLARDTGLSPQMVHLAASHAAIDLPETHLDMIRLGILGYGVSPFADRTPQQLGFAPVLTLVADVVGIDGERCHIGVGYRHGLLAPQHPDAHLKIGGNTLRIDQVGFDETVLVGSITPGSIQLGDTVAVFGAGSDCPVEVWASWCHTIGDEILARLHPDIPRGFVNDES